MAKKIKLVIECDENSLADSLRELATTIDEWDTATQIGTISGDNYTAKRMLNATPIQAGSTETYEHTNVTLSKEKTPIAWENHVQDLVKSGHSREDAEKYACEPIEMEMFYEQGAGLFLVESGATECHGLCKSPYTGAEIVPCEW